MSFTFNLCSFSFVVYFYVNINCPYSNSRSLSVVFLALVMIWRGSGCGD